MLNHKRFTEDNVYSSRPQDRVQHATTLVRTEALAQKGFDHIRVLSESKFLDLVRHMVAESLAERHEASGAEPAAAINSAAECSGPKRPAPECASPERLALEKSSEAVYQAKWEELRARHEGNLRRIEGGMRRLSSTFEGIRDALSRLHASAPDQPVESEWPAAVTQRQADLLREMLL